MPLSLVALQEWAAQSNAPVTAASGKQPKRNQLWRAFWAAHQRFFRHMCMASKVHTSSSPVRTLF